MALDVRRAGAADYGRWVKGLVCGDPGAGKTRSASTWPNVLIANVEGGVMSVSDRQTPVVDIFTSNKLEELHQSLDQAPQVREKLLGVPVDTIVLDTLDEIARILIKEHLEEEKKESMAIQDWGWLGDHLRGIVRSFRNLDMHVIFNCHVKSSEDSESGRMFFKPAIPGAMGDEIAGYVDLAVLLHARPKTVVVDGESRREIVRFVQTYPDANHPWIKDRSGKLPMEFPINLNDDFKRMDALIFADIPEAGAPVTPTAVAAPAAPVEAPKEEPKEQPKEEPKPAEAPAAPEVPAEAPTPSEPEVQPESTPEPQPEPQTQPAPAPAAEPTPEPTPEPAAAPETAPETVSSGETAKPEWATCQSCGGDVENKDQADLSYIRFREHLCRKCFADRKKK